MIVFALPVAIYALIGLFLAVCMAHGSNLRGRVVCFFIWPWVLWADGTPRIRWLTHFSGQEVVIEETTALDGSVKQTVRQRNGYEFVRTH